jgi:hypothetical protein
MRSAEKFAFEIVRPAMQRADDVLSLAATVEHDGLPVAAHVRQQFDLRLLVTDEHAPLAFAGQGKIIPRFGHHEIVADVTRTFLEKGFDFAR